MKKHVSHETSRGNEVPVVARRRRHTRSEKLRILEEADRCEEYGGLSALARREGVYVSTLSRWKVWRERMQAEDTPGKVQNPQAETYESLRGQVRKMERENKRLRLRLARAEGLLELQKKSRGALGQPEPGRAERREVLMSLAKESVPKHGVRATCAALEISRSTYYRRRGRAGAPPGPKARPSPPRRLSGSEEQQVLDVLNSERFAERAVPEVYATLLDEGVWLCSMRTMYRILKRHGEVQDRRNQLRHPVYAKPELLATGLNQVWSWDITKVRGPAPGIFYQLYVMLDIFSRYVVGWVLAEYESGAQAQALIASCHERQGVGPNQLTVHSDRGKSMRSHEVLGLLADLQVRRSYSRPHVSNDNPYSEAQFKTLKYQPTYPERFGSFEEAVATSASCWNGTTRNIGTPG